MIVKLIAPGIIPGDYVTVNHMAGVPQRGDRVLVETRRDGDEYDEELLTVKSVTWPVEVLPSIRNHAFASLVEVLLDRAEDAGDWLTICNKLRHQQLNPGKDLNHNAQSAMRARMHVRTSLSDFSDRR